MATTKKKSSRINKQTDMLGLVRRYAWPTIALASIVINVVLIAGVAFIIKYQPLTLAQLSVTRNCTNENYAKIIKLSKTDDQKKFAAAALCFTDYDTGKAIDLNSLKPNLDSPAQLPPKQ